MELCTSELQQKLTTLRRAPPPKAPVPGKDLDKSPEGELFTKKLKPIKPPAIEPKNDKPAEENESEDNANNNGQVKTRTSSIKERTRAFENGSPGKPPIPASKPTVASKKPAIPKPTVATKPAANGSSNHNARITRPRPPSVINKPM